MTDQKHHDSLAPKGAFATADASDTERAAARTANLVASQPVEDTTSDADEEPHVTVTIATAEDDGGLCADELIPSGGERVSMEHAMRALIEMRLEQTRPSDEFGTFDLAPVLDATPSRNAQPTTYQPTMNSLAPIEMAPIVVPTTKAPEARKTSPFPYLAAAAVLLIGVGLYRRADRTDAPIAPTAHAASLESSTPRVEPTPNRETGTPAEVSAEQDIATLSVSESDDAILTLGTPTIVYVREAVAEEDAEPSTRASKEKVPGAPTVARTAGIATPKVTRVLPAAPTREEIVAGFNSVRAEVLACANGGGGVAPIEATVVSSGRITHANVGGYYQGTPAGSCIARVLRKARFTEFSGESITVSFPYTL